MVWERYRPAAGTSRASRSESLIEPGADDRFHDYNLYPVRPRC